MNARLIHSTASAGRRAGGFTLLEMVITLGIFILLATAVFGLMTGVLESTSTLQDNQNHHDQIVALNAYLKNKLTSMPAVGTLVSYQRGTGDGLLQNGIVYGFGHPGVGDRRQAAGQRLLSVETDNVYPPRQDQASCRKMRDRSFCKP